MPGTRVLARSDDIFPPTLFFLANRDFTDKHGQLIGIVNGEPARAAEWAETHKDEAAQYYPETSDVALDAQKITVEPAIFAFSPLADGIIARQQVTADRFHKLGLLPKPPQTTSSISVKAAISRPYQARMPARRLPM